MKTVQDVSPQEALHGSVQVEAATSDRVNLRILATSDLHMHLTSFDYSADRDGRGGGLSRAARLIAQARAEFRNCLLFDNGDFLQGSAIGEYVATRRLSSHPMIAAMNAVGFDAANLGNHEFSNGIDFLLTALGEARFPVLSANVFQAGTGEPFLLPEIILNRGVEALDGSRHVLRVGVAGVLPPQTSIWDRHQIGERLFITGMAEALKASVARLRARGADVVVALAHTGIGTENPSPLAENMGLRIAALEGIDVLVLGHVHLPFPGPEVAASPLVDPERGRLNGVPTVIPGCFGSHVGVVDLRLKHTAKGWTVLGSAVELRPVTQSDAFGQTTPAVDEDQDVLDLSRTVHDETREWGAGVICRSPERLQNYFAMVSNDPVSQLIHEAQTEFVRSRLSGTPLADLPVLSATPPFKVGGRGGAGNYCDIAPGNLLVRHLTEIYPQPNGLMALAVTGFDLRRWLERSAEVFNSLRPGLTDQLLLNPDFPAFHFDTISGLTYTIDLSGGGDVDGRRVPRIVDMGWQGRPIDEDQSFILATNSYRGNGGGGFVVPGAIKVVYSDRKPVRDIIAAHLASRPQLPFATEVSWRFARMPGASAIFETAPEALANTGSVAHLRVSPLGVTEKGFLRMSLML